MAAVVIRKKDVNRIGKGLLKEMFEFLLMSIYSLNLKK